jgi:hypothetical protein
VSIKLRNLRCEAVKVLARTVQPMMMMMMICTGGIFSQKGIITLKTFTYIFIALIY